MSEPLDFSAMGQIIQRKRIALNMSQYNLADESGVPRSAVRRIEAGDSNTKLADIYCICNALGLSVSDVLPSPTQSTASITHLVNFLSKFNEADQEKIIEGLTTAITVISAKINLPERSSSELVLK